MKNISMRELKQSIYMLKRKGYRDDKICIYLTKDTIKEIVDGLPRDPSIVYELDFGYEDMRFENIPVKLHFENKVCGIAEEVKL